MENIETIEIAIKRPTVGMRSFIAEKFADALNYIRLNNYTQRVRDLRQNPRVGARATHYANDGRTHPGTIMDARFYRNGMVEIYFLSDDRVVNGWRDASSLLPEPE